MDSKDYPIDGKAFFRPSARSIIINEGKIALIYSRKYKYYKFPGGGIEKGESREEALIRETLEEAGLSVIADTIKEFGKVRRKFRYNQKGFDYMVQDNYYYLCQAEKQISKQKLDEYESNEGFTLKFMIPQKAIYLNRNVKHGPKNPTMIEREARVLEILIKEGYFK